MRINVFAIFAGLIAALPNCAVAAVVPTAPVSIALTSLLGSANTVIAGPFTFSNFSLWVQSQSHWETGPSSLAATLAVRPISGSLNGIELAGTPDASGQMATYVAVAIDYQLTAASTNVGGATSTLFAWTTHSTAAMGNQFIVTPPASSNSPSEADTSWSGASPTAVSGDAVAIQFVPSTALAVTDIATISPTGASTLSFAVDTVFVPEPGGLATAAAGCFLRRRRRAVL